MLHQNILSKCPYRVTLFPGTGIMI